MTQRIPEGMDPMDWAEHQVREAERRGELDAPSAKGRPLEIRARRDPNWWVTQKLKDEGVAPIPPAIRLRLEHDELVEALLLFRRRDEVVAAVESLNGRIRYANSHGLPGPPSTLMPMHLERHLARWADAAHLRPQPAPSDDAPATTHRSWWRRFLTPSPDDD